MDNVNLEELAQQVMNDWDLEPEFSQKAVDQANSINKPAPPPQGVQNLCNLLWCSIDNDDSRDLDQLTYGEVDGKGNTTIWVAIADVDALVPKDTPIDQHAEHNTTSVYTPARIFSMLPIKLSTDLTSLNQDEDRMSMVTKIVIDQEGKAVTSSIFPALVRNYAKLAYNSVGAWLEGTGPMPDKIAQVKNMDKVIKCQHEVAQRLKTRRHEVGSLTFDAKKVEARVLDNGEIQLEVQPHNFAHQLIEEFMIASNNALATLFRDNKVPSLRRVVRIPQQWDKIVELARNFGETLPVEPDSKALDEFLVKRQKADPTTFQDLSLAVIKLMGKGEYVVENVGDKPVGHFGLALVNYTHATAPTGAFPILFRKDSIKLFC